MKTRAMLYAVGAYLTDCNASHLSQEDAGHLHGRQRLANSRRDHKGRQAVSQVIFHPEGRNEKGTVVERPSNPSEIAVCTTKQLDDAHAPADACMLHARDRLATNDVVGLPRGWHEMGAVIPGGIALCERTRQGEPLDPGDQP